MKGFGFRFALLFGAVFTVLFFAVWFYLSVVSTAEAGEPPPEHDAFSASFTTVFKTNTARLQTASAAHDFRVEMALTPGQHAQGLMGRVNVPPGTGMVFDFGTPRPITMWMKNTPASLDIFFADDEGRIVYIAHKTIPFSEARLSPPDPLTAVRYVFEVAAGTAERLGIGIGDRLTLGREQQQGPKVR